MDSTPSLEKPYATDLDAIKREVRVTPFRRGGKGGQHRNKVESAVRIVHIPSGLTAIAAEHRVQGRNLQLAYKRLQRKLTLKNRTKRLRISTRPSRTANARRLEQKRRQARKKTLRCRILAANQI